VVVVGGDTIVVVVVERAATKRWPPRFTSMRAGCVNVSSPMLIVTVTFRLSRSGSVICEARRRMPYCPGPTRRRRTFLSPGWPFGGK
jgi:hypothetical protein